MTDFLATPETLASIVLRAVDGDVIRLSPGSYGDVKITRIIPSPGVGRMVGDPAASLNSLVTRGAEGWTFDGLNVSFAPTTTTRESQNVVFIDASKRITFTRGRITAGVAVNGIPETETKLDITGNVLGWPLGRGFYAQLSEDVEISESEVWGVQRGLLTYKSNGVRFLKNHVHDVRRTFILGDANDLTIAGNYLYGSKPWRWGQTPIGDHGDFIALFTPTGMPPMARVVIRDNVAEQRPGGTAILGFTMATINGLDVRGNVITGSDHQGFLATDVTGLTLYDNQFNGRAQILLRYGTVGARGANNLYAAYADYSKGTGDNQIAPSGYVAPPPPPDPRDVRIGVLEADLASALARIEAARLALQ